MFIVIPALVSATKIHSLFSAYDFWFFWHFELGYSKEVMLNEVKQNAKGPDWGDFLMLSFQEIWYG